MHKYCGHGPHAGPAGFDAVMFFGLITSVVPGNTQEHPMLGQGLMHGVQHGVSFETEVDGISIALIVIYRKNYKISLERINCDRTVTVRNNNDKIISDFIFDGAATVTD